MTASVGVALLDGASELEAVALADAAMYAAKSAGGDRFVVFDPSDPRPDHPRQASEASRLRRALNEGRFVLHCQPVWNLAEQRVEMHELLIRMRDETSGRLIAPNAFLYAAERFKLISEIDSWVVSEAVNLIATHARQGRRVVLCVNLSGRSIGDPAVDAHIDAALSESGIDPSCLVFEVTETAAIGNIEAAVAFSQRLLRRGCRFALDDFGAGFASFYYLKRLPFDFLKIDGDFVRGLPDHAVDQLVVNAIVAIARGMGKQTIAEFVTAKEIADLLLASGVDHAQGYHFGRPRPVNEVLSPAPASRAGRQAGCSPASKPRRSSHFVVSSTGTIRNARPATRSHSSAERLVVPNASCRNGTLITSTSIRSSQRIARFSHLLAKSASRTECRSER